MPPTTRPLRPPAARSFLHTARAASNHQRNRRRLTGVGAAPPEMPGDPPTARPSAADSGSAAAPERTQPPDPTGVPVGRATPVDLDAVPSGANLQPTLRAAPAVAVRTPVRSTPGSASGSTITCRSTDPFEVLAHARLHAPGTICTASRDEQRSLGNGRSMNQQRISGNPRMSIATYDDGHSGVARHGTRDQAQWRGDTGRGMRPTFGDGTQWRNRFAACSIQRSRRMRDLRGARTWAGSASDSGSSSAICW